MKYLYLILLVLSNVCYGQDNTLTKQQEKILKILQNKRMPNGENANVFYENTITPFLFQDYQNNLIKKEIIRLLSPKWTEAELEAQSKRYLKPERTEKYAKDIIKKNPKLSYKQVYDSLLLWEINENRKNNTRIAPNIVFDVVKLTGYLYLQDGIPLLKTLQSTNDNLQIKLALARMQVQPYYGELLNQYNPDIIIKQVKIIEVSDLQSNTEGLRYIGTQEALQQFEKWLHIEKPCEEGFSHSISYTTIPKQITLELVKYLPDLQEYSIKDKETRLRFNNFYNDLEMNNLNDIGTSKRINETDIKYFKKYFKENKGKIKTNKYWY